MNGSAGTAGLHDIWVPAQAMYPTADGGCSDITTVELTEGVNLVIDDIKNVNTLH